MRHYRKTLRTYAKLNANDKQLKGCSYCNDHKNKTYKLVREGKTMVITHNRVMYDMFEGQRVTENLMIIPIRHVESLDDFNDEEKLEYMTILGEYEKQNYDVYARGKGSVTRSMLHQHTHLIKMENRQKLPKILFFIRKPYFLFDR
jgi:hypothetical protein